jgi:hypothetical protein
MRRYKRVQGERAMKAVAHGCLAGVLALSFSATALAQEPKSVPLAKQLATALDAAKLDSVAAKDPSSADVFIGALYIRGVQLLVVSAKYTAPALLNDKLAKKEYRDVYIDLNSAAVPATKVFIEDMGTDGLRAKRDEGPPYDTFELAGKRTAFDGDWKKQNLSEDEYMKVFSTADERYTQMLMALLAQLKKTS